MDKNILSLSQSKQPKSVEEFKSSEKPQSIAFEIDIVSLRTGSPRPKHVALRFDQERSRSTSASSSCPSSTGLSSSSSCSSLDDDVNDDNEDARLDRHQAMLELRRDRITKHLQRVQSCAEEARERMRKDSVTRRACLDAALADAQIKRENLIDKRKTTNALRVARAIERAHEKRARDLSERSALRQAMTQKLRSSSWRRQQIAKFPRSRLSTSSSLADALRSHAAHEIQTWWRTCRLVGPILMFSRLGLTVDAMKAMSFADATTRLQSKPVIHSAMKILQNLLLSAVDPAPGLDRSSKSARVFLTHLLILSHGSEIVGDETGPLEKELIVTARALDEACTSLLSLDFSQNCPLVHSHIASFLQAWFGFHVTFCSFKKKDVETVVTNLVAHSVELARLLANVASQSSEAEAEYRPNIQHQLHVTRRRIASVGGQDALVTLDTAILESGLADIVSDATSLQNSSNNNTPLSRLPNDSVLNGSPRKKQVDNNGSLDTQRPQQKQNPRPRSFHSLSSAPDNSKVRDVIENHTLAHEAVLNPNFKLQAPEDPFNIRQIATKALRDSIADLVVAGDYSFVPKLAEEIRDSMVTLAVDTRLASVIASDIDPTHIESLIEQKCFDFADFLKTLVQLMLQVAAPARDNEIKALLEIPLLADVVVEINTILNQMHCDLGNYYLQQLRPVLRTRIVDYEIKKFEEYLLTFECSTEDSFIPEHPGFCRTRKWLEEAANELWNVQNTRNPEGINLTISASYPKFEEVFYEALLGIATGNKKPTNALENVPETLSLDIQRLAEMRMHTQAMAIASSLLLLSKTSILALRQAGSATLIQLSTDLYNSVINRSSVILGEELELIIRKAIEGNVNNNSQSLTNDILNGEQNNQVPVNDLLVSIVSRVISGRDPVFSIVFRRICSALRYRMATGVPPQTADSLASQGLEEIRKQIDTQGILLYSLSKHNKAVYAKWYDLILKSWLKNKIINEMPQDQQPL